MEDYSQDSGYRFKNPVIIESWHEIFLPLSSAKHDNHCEDKEINFIIDVLSLLVFVSAITNQWF